MEINLSELSIPQRLFGCRFAFGALICSVLLSSTTKKITLTFVLPAAAHIYDLFHAFITSRLIQNSHLPVPSYVLPWQKSIYPNIADVKGSKFHSIQILFRTRFCLPCMRINLKISFKTNLPQESLQKGAFTTSNTATNSNECFLPKTHEKSQEHKKNKWPCLGTDIHLINCEVNIKQCWFKHGFDFNRSRTSPCWANLRTHFSVPGARSSIYKLHICKQYSASQTLLSPYVFQRMQKSINSIAHSF